MPMAAFDTMGVAKRLQREFEMPQKQAEGVAVVLHENFVGNVATRDDIRRLDDRMQGVEGRMQDLEGRMQNLEGRMQGLEGRMQGLEGRMQGLEGRMQSLDDKITAQIEASEMKMTIRLGGMIAGIFVFFELLNRFFPIMGG